MSDRRSPSPAPRVRGVPQLLTGLVLCVAAAWGCHGEPNSAEPGSRLPQASSAAASADVPTSMTAARNLAEDEARGGHTLARHVGLTDDDLRVRLRRERRIAAASRWTDRATAEHVVAATLTSAGERLANWLSRTGPRPNLALSYRGEGRHVIGRSLVRGARSVADCYEATVVLRWDPDRGDYFVLTAYPEARR